MKLMKLVKVSKEQLQRKLCKGTKAAVRGCPMFSDFILSSEPPEHQWHASTLSQGTGYWEDIGRLLRSRFWTWSAFDFSLGPFEPYL